MWAQQLTAPGTFAEVEADVPGPGDLRNGEVLLDVLAGGVCGSDLPPFKGVVPLFMGEAGSAPSWPTGFPMHEVVGRVVASRHPDHPADSTVVGWGTNFNVMSERIVSLGDDLAEVDHSLPPEIAVMLQPLACVIYALEQIPSLAGKHVAVLGQGPIGLLFSHVAKSLGAQTVTAVDRLSRAAICSAFGVDDFIHSDTGAWARALSSRDAPNLVIEAIGHNISTLNHALEAVTPGGLVYYFGIPDDPVYPVNVSHILRKNLTLMSGTTLDRGHMLRRAMSYLNTHKAIAACYVTHSLARDQAREAFQLAASPAGDQGKITLKIAE